MTQDEKDAINYQFSGYNFEMIQLDETGDAYIVTGTHPYYKNQPKYWEKPYYTGGFMRVCGGQVSTSTAINAEVTNKTGNKLYPMLIMQ